MSDLIKRDDLLECTCFAAEIKNPYAMVVMVVDVESIPAVDAVEVVRCGDCRHIVQIGNAYYCKVWRGFNGYGIDGFCCYGERREK